jgi:hypothetical protein
MVKEDHVTDKEIIAELLNIASVVLGKSKLRDAFIESLPKDAKRTARRISREIDASTEELIKAVQQRTKKLAHELLSQACIELVQKHLAVLERHHDELPEEIYEVLKGLSLNNRFDMPGSMP